MIKMNKNFLRIKKDVCLCLEIESRLKNICSGKPETASPVWRRLIVIKIHHRTVVVVPGCFQVTKRTLILEYEFAIGTFLIIGFLSVAVASSVLLKRLHFPYTIGLVVIGGIFGLIAKQFNYALLMGLTLTPETILYLILPTLIYDASINMDLRALRKNIVPILLLAVLGLLISAGIIGGLLSTFSVMSIGAALLFGALISATDPVAVIALFSEIGAPRRLVTLVDGESIFNDATAIVLFSIILAAINSGVHTVEILFLSSFVSFLMVLIGGLAIGAVTGALGGLVIRLQKDNVILQITVSLIMAYISFITADLLDVSGVMSTLAAGIVVSLMSSDVLKHENHYFMENFWNYFSFVANSFVFLLLGLTEANSYDSLGAVAHTLRLMLLVIPAVTIARALIIYLLIPLYNLFAKNNRISLAYQTILFWGGLRGAVPVALVLAIPTYFPWRDTTVHITLWYILFTLLVQGTTVKGLMRKLNIRPEKSYFDYHVGINYSLEFPTVRLLELVTSRVLRSFKDEGFFVSDSEQEETEGGSYLLNRGQKYLAINTDNSHLKITAADEQDLAYGRQTLYETLLDLDNSVSSLQDMVKSPEMNKIVQEETVDSKATFSLARYLKKEFISVDLKSDNKRSVIEELIDIAVAAGVADKEIAIESVLEREATMSTGFENGVAIPHAKCNASESIILVVGVKTEGVDFESLDGKPATMFFLILSPKAQVGPTYTACCGNRAENE